MRKTRSTSGFGIFEFFISIVFLAVILSFPISAYLAYGTQETITITVNDKERVNDGDSSRYLVFTNKEVFENTDSLWLLKFNSSDVYNELERGETYKVRVYGFRIPVLSMYRNIIRIEGE